jgi:hypothetical protein
MIAPERFAPPDRHAQGLRPAIPSPGWEISGAPSAQGFWGFERFSTPSWQSEFGIPLPRRCRHGEKKVRH